MRKVIIQCNVDCSPAKLPFSSLLVLMRPVFGLRFQNNVVYSGLQSNNRSTQISLQILEGRQ